MPLLLLMFIKTWRIMLRNNAANANPSLRQLFLLLFRLLLLHAITLPTLFLFLLKHFCIFSIFLLLLVLPPTLELLLLVVLVVLVVLMALVLVLLQHRLHLLLVLPQHLMRLA